MIRQCAFVLALLVSLCQSVTCASSERWESNAVFAPLHTSSCNSSAVVFTTFVSKEVQSYSANALLFNQRYLVARNYSLRVLTEATRNDYVPADRRWNKIKAVSNSLISWASNVSHLVVFDADLFLLDTVLSIESIVEQHPQALLIMSEDSMDIGNTGFMIIRNHPWNIQFFDTWWNERGRADSNCDQHVLNYLLDSLLPADRVNVAILPAKQLNSIWPAIEHFSVSDSVLHLMGETNVVRAKVAEHLVAQVPNSSSIKEGNGSGALAVEGSLESVPYDRANITRAVLRDLKQQVVLQEVYEWKRKVTQEGADFKDYHELREAVGQLCAAKKRSSTKSVLKLCIELTEEVIMLHERALVSLASVQHPRGHSTTQQRLFHASELCALIIEVLELFTSTTLKGIRGKRNKIPQQNTESVMIAVQRALAVVDRFASLLDMSAQGMQTIIHTKRGMVYSVLSEFRANSEQWQLSLEAEQSAMAEFSSALHHTSEDDGEFPGLVVKYVHSATRLARSFQRVGRLPEAVEWADIALSNALVRFESSANEMRLRARELSAALGLRADLAGLQGDIAKQADSINAVDAISARFVFG
jgi:hypothetical protein